MTGAGHILRRTKIQLLTRGVLPVTISDDGHMDSQQEYVLRTVEEHGIKFIRLWFADVLGTLKSVAIAPAELEQAFNEGIGFDGSAIEGLTRGAESDMLAMPDAATFQILPWRGETAGTARMFCDILTPDGHPAAADSRHVLKRALARAAEQGFTLYTHPEVEFYLFEQPHAAEPNAPLVPVDQAGYFDHAPRGSAHDFRRSAITLLESMGISVEFSHHEAGPGQNEMDLRYADALTTADNLMTFRTIIKEVALEQGVLASFMPKPLADHPGSGMHTHMSLFAGDRNAFYEPGQRFDLSRTARSFIAGVLHHAAEITAITNQNVNSYKRLWGGAEAPSYICWGHNNRSALVRIPMYKPGKGESCRVEYRALDAAANPYLAFAVLLTAGLRGIEQNYELRDGAEDDVWELTDTERAALGIEPLPQSLGAAIRLMEKSELVAEALGEHVFNHVLRNKRHEWAQYRAQVTPFEINNFLRSQ